MQVKSIEVIHEAHDYPITPKNHGTEFLMDHRHLWLRSKKQHAVMKIRNEIIRATYEFFNDNGFTKIDPPILTASAPEGTSELFHTKPLSSRNPDVDELTAGKPRMVVLNRVDQADPEGTKRWAEHFRAKGYAVLESDAKSGVGTAKFAGAVRELLADKLRAYAEKGMTGRVVRVMILGIPNVGKSTFINKVAGRKTAKTEDRPGVTRSKQWVPIDRNLELLDTPGILWPKFDDQSVGMNLAYTGAVKDDILDVETLGCHLMAYLGEHYPDALKAAYKLSALPEREAEENDIAYGYRLLEAAGKKRGFLISGGEVDTERMAKILLDEFRSGKLGRFTLELP